MAEMGAYEAKTHFSALLERVQKGETVTITKHGVPIATLGPVKRRDQEDVSRAVQELKEFSKGRTLGGLSIKDLVNEGRR